MPRKTRVGLLLSFYNVRMIRRALAALLSLAIVLYAFPFNAVAAEIDAPLSPRSPGATPIVAPQIPGAQGLPTLPDSSIPSLAIDGVNASVPRQLSALSKASASVPVASAQENGALAASQAATAAETASAQAAIPAVAGKSVAQSTGRIESAAALRPSVGSRIAAGLKSLKFWNKTVSDDDVAGAASSGAAPLARSAPQGKDEKAVPAPQKPSDDDGGKAKWFGLGGLAAMFIGALALQQIGVESQAAAMPGLMQKVFSDFSIVTDITIVRSLSGIAGRVIGPLVVQRFSLKKAYLGGLGAKLAVNALMAGLIATGHITVPGLALLYGIDGLIGGVTQTAEKAIGPALLGQDQDKLEKYGATKQVVLEVLGSLMPPLTGFIVTQFSAIPALIAFPIVYGASIAVLAMFLRIPQKVELVRKAKLKEQPVSKNVFGEFFGKISRGAKVVWNTPVLKYTFLAYTAYMMLNPFLYTVLAPGFGNLMQAAFNVSSDGAYTMLTGLYSAGGLLGGVLMLREQKRLKTLPAGEVSEKLRKSLLRWMTLGTFGLAAIATLAIPMAPLFVVKGLPVTIPALALFAFGVAQVIANIKQENFLMSRAPEKDVNDVIGFLGAASLGVSTAGLVALKFLFKGKLPFGWQPIAAFTGLHGFTAFLAIAIAMIPLAAFYVYLTRRLDKASRLPPPAKPDAK